MIAAPEPDTDPDAATQTRPGPAGDDAAGRLLRALLAGAGLPAAAPAQPVAAEPSA